MPLWNAPIKALLLDEKEEAPIKAIEVEMFYFGARGFK